MDKTPGSRRGHALTAARVWQARMNLHKPLPGLLDHVNAGSVGGPLMPLPPANVAAVGNAGYGNARTLVNFSPDIKGEEKQLDLGRVPEVLTASVFASGGTGPLVGIAQWGSGNGQQQQMEFDIPQTFGQFLGSNPGGTNQTAGGVLFSVPGTSLRIDARNDANLIANAGNGNVAIGVAANGTPSATASIGLGNRAGGTQLTRTIYGTYAPGGGLPATNIVNIQIPAFAKRFTIFRSSTVVGPIQVEMIDFNGSVVDGPYNLAAGATSPTFLLTPSVLEVAIANGGGAPLQVVGCIFELGL